MLLTIDELQAAAASDLTLIAAALQGLNNEFAAPPVMFAASGLPNTFEVLKAAGVTHPNRLFKFHPVPLLLKSDDARYAIVEPARQRRVAWEPDATDLIVELSSGYPGAPTGVCRPDVDGRQRCARHHGRGRPRRRRGSRPGPRAREPRAAL